MRLLFVAVRYHSNQVPLVRALIDAGHEVAFDVLTEGKSEDHSLVRPTLMPIAAGPLRALRRANPVNAVAYHADHTHPTVAWYLRRMRALRPDVVVVRDPNRPYAWRAALAARLLGLRVVLYTQGAVHGTPDRRSRWQRAAAIRAFGAVWISPVPGDAALPKVHPYAHYVPFVADLTRAVKTRWFDADRVHLLCVGKFTPRKNHALLIDVVEELGRRHDLHLTLVGEVSTDEHRAHHAELRALIEKRGLGDRVSIRTNVPFADLRQVYVDHDVFVLPSRDEPASVSVLEAMAHGLPVVCSTTSGTRWYVEPGRTGAIFRSDDRDHLRDELEAIVGDRDAIQRMGAAGRERAESVHHPDVVARKLIDVIERWRSQP